MKNAIIVHGKSSKKSYYNPDFKPNSSMHWIPWLQKQLMLKEIETQTPTMINDWCPDYKVWKEIFERQKINENTLLIGHSCGGGFLVQWLSENKDVKVGHVFLVAPAFGDRYNPETPYESPLKNGFFDFDIDENLLIRVKSLTLFNSDNDSVRVNTALEMIKNKLPKAEYKLFSGYGHFCGTVEQAADTFPELFECIEAKLLN